MSSDNDFKTFIHNDNSFYEINNEQNDSQDELGDSDSRASQSTLVNTESVINNSVTENKKDDIKPDLDAKDAPSEVQIGQCSYITNKVPLVVAVTHLDNAFNSNKPTIYGLNKSYDIMEQFQSTSTLVDKSSSSSNPDCVSQNTLTGTIQSFQSTSTLLINDITPKSSYSGNVSSKTLTFTNSSLPKCLDNSLHNIKNVTFNNGIPLKTVINYQNTGCNANDEPSVIVTLPKSILNKETFKLSEHHLNMGDDIVDQSLLSNIWQKPYSIETKQFFNKNVTIPDNKAIKEMIVKNTEVPKRTCAEEFRSGNPTDIPQLWEKIVTVLDNAFKKLEESISQKILNDIKSLHETSKPLTCDSKIDDVELLSIATDMDEKKYAGIPIQCDLIRASIIDELAKKHYFDKEHLPLSPDSIDKILIDESKTTEPYTTDNTTLTSSTHYTKVKFRFPMNRVKVLGQSMRPVTKFLVANFYLFGGTVGFFTFVFVTYGLMVIFVYK